MPQSEKLDMTRVAMSGDWRGPPKNGKERNDSANNTRRFGTRVEPNRVSTAGFANRETAQQLIKFSNRNEPAAKT
jgi:hypothetical protein